jgi:hypothetical protein
MILLVYQIERPPLSPKRLGKVWGKSEAMACNILISLHKNGAGDGLRTRDPQLGRLML